MGIDVAQIGFLYHGQEIIAVAHGLEKRERTKQHQSHDGDKHQLLAGVNRARGGGGKTGQNQGKRDNHRHRT